MTAESLSDTDLARIVRVDHAGEYGAQRIYEGQLAVLGRTRFAGTLEHMRAQEMQHLRHFEKEIVTRGVRPTALLPLWHIAGYALGAATALMGPKAAMACTVAVEETIDRHYAQQRLRLGEQEPKLAAAIDQFRAEELEHRDTGLHHGAEQAPAYRLLYRAVATGSKAAIWLSERV